ncbi:HNH endonuclease [Streptomyces sp. NPDC088785]|uniref:HNH endonuclease n=1 Tax=Streptomyces sp. NPDC088785 TaxID=3365897 RepID=UPI0038002A92
MPEAMNVIVVQRRTWQNRRTKWHDVGELSSVGGKLCVGEVLRSARDRDPSVPVMAGHPDIHHVTASDVLAQVQVNEGINPIREVRVSGVARRPAILIRSSPWKAGSVETPWHDEFDLRRGRVSYFGDHRVDHSVPVGATDGNRALLRTWEGHRAATARERALAAPLLVFATVTRNGTPKGYVKFCGLGVIEDVEEVQQQDRGRPFPNYRYELALLDLEHENDQVSWAWIEARGDRRLEARETLAAAPRSWRRWVEHGHAVLPEIRQRPMELDEPVVRGRAADGPVDDALPPALPRPRDENAPQAGERDGARQRLTVEQLMERLRNLKVHQQNGRSSRHKPLALMWAIARNSRGGSRLVPWPEFRREVGALLVEYGLPQSSSTPEYPFWHLRTSGLWDVQGVPPEQQGKVSAAAFDRAAPEAGFTDQADRLLSDPFVRSQAIAVLRETHFAEFAQHELMLQLGLEGYESASGVESSATEEEERDREPVGRRATHTSRLVRDVALAKRVKEMHEDRCQVCGIRIATRFGTYSEAAHIRGLGRPHHGPDELANLLVLCPNHHVQFDFLALYIDPHGVVRETWDGRRSGELRRLPGHPISEAHLRYHRALCGRDTSKDSSAEPRRTTAPSAALPER